MKISHKRCGIGSFVLPTICDGGSEPALALSATQPVGEVFFKRWDSRLFVSVRFPGCATCRTRFAAGFSSCARVATSMLFQHVLQIGVIGCRFCRTKVSNFLLVRSRPVYRHPLLADRRLFFTVIVVKDRITYYFVNREIDFRHIHARAKIM